MKLTEEKISSKTLYEGRVINLKVNEVILENGKTATREIVEHPGGVCVLGIDEDKNVLMVKQYRAPFERVLLEAEVLDLKGNPNRPAEGVVIESRLDKQKGPVATILVKNGTLRKGDTFISGSQFGKVRAMFNYKGRRIKTSY